MRFCCQTTEQKGKYALQMHQTPSALSQISQQRDVILKGLVPKIKSQVLNHMAKNSQKGEIKFQNFLNYMMISNNNQQHYSLKKVLKSNYEQLLDNFYNSNNKWTDPDFPPQQKSFGLSRQTEKVVWKRIDQIIKKPIFISGSIDPADILQGKIGDCYFLSAISGLAENDKRISKIFGDININKNGIYMARILHRGVYQEVVVDDYFPCSKRDGKLMGSRPSNGEEIWVMILQKCWAKLYGSYEAIDGGLPNEVLHAFSAAPIFQYLTNVEGPDQQTLFQLMMQATASNWVMCCGTYPRPDMEKMGLVQGHAYTVLSVFDKPRPLIKIRNPWGEKEWRGGASDRDNFWRTVSPNDKKRLGFGVNDDGIFFMFWQDFLQFFQLVNICKVQQNSNYYYDELTYPRDQPVYSALQTKGGSATIGLTQANTRSLPVEQPRYASSTIIVGRKLNNTQGDNYQYIKTLSANNQCDVNLQIELVSGEYVVYSTLIGRNQQQQATISCYGETPVQLSPLYQINNQEFLHSIFLDHARKNKQNQQKIFGRMDVWVCMEIVYECGYGYTVVHIGPSVKTKLGLTFNQQQYIDNSFELLPPFKDAGTFKITCESGQDCIVLCRIIRKNYAIEASLPIPNIKRLC